MCWTPGIQGARVLTFAEVTGKATRKGRWQAGEQLAVTGKVGAGAAGNLPSNDLQGAGEKASFLGHFLP